MSDFFRKRYGGVNIPDTTIGEGHQQKKQKVLTGVTIGGYEIGNPLHFHCGPGNDISDEKSVSVVDENCRQHDIMYGAMQARTGLDPKYYTSDADRKFIRDQLKTDTVAGAMYALPFLVKNAIMPEYPAAPPMLALPAPFSKKPQMRNSKRVKLRRRRPIRRRVKRRRRSKARSRLTRLQIYKTIGIRNTYHRNIYNLLQGTFETAVDATSQPAKSTNNTFLFHLCTVNDFYHYEQTATASAGTVANQLELTGNVMMQDMPYFTKSGTVCTLSNLSNVNLLMTPVRVQLKHDLPNNDPGSYTGYPDHVTAYNILSLMYQDILDVDSGAPVSTVNAPGSENLVSPESRSFQSPNFQFPTGYPLPWKLLRKRFDIKIGKPELFPVQSSKTVYCRGHKGVMPLVQMDDQSNPSSAVSSSILNNRAPTGFRKKTVAYFYMIRQASHVVATTGNAGEAYLGGPFKVAVDVLRKTDAVGIPMNSIVPVLSAQTVKYTDLRPWASTTAGAAKAMVDTSETGSAVVSIVN